MRGSQCGVGDSISQSLVSANGIMWSYTVVQPSIYLYPTSFYPLNETSTLLPELLFGLEGYVANLSLYKCKITTLIKCYETATPQVEGILIFFL